MILVWLAILLIFVAAVLIFLGISQVRQNFGDITKRDSSITLLTLAGILAATAFVLLIFEVLCKCCINSAPNYCAPPCPPPCPPPCVPCNPCGPSYGGYGGYGGYAQPYAAASAPYAINVTCPPAPVVPQIVSAPAPVSYAAPTVPHYVPAPAVAAPVSYAAPPIVAPIRV